MRNFGHRYIFDFDFIKRITKNINFTKIEVINNYCDFDKNLNTYLKLKKPEVWSLETDTYLLIK